MSKILKEDFLNKIISENINSYLQENILMESKKNTKPKKKKYEDKVKSDDSEKDEKPQNLQDLQKKKKKWRKNAKKMAGGLRQDFDVEEDEQYNAEVNDEDQEALSDALDCPELDLKAIATQLYPNHNPAGAQSQLRKKIKGETSDSGYVYRIKIKEMRKLKQILNKIIDKITL